MKILGLLALFFKFGALFLEYLKRTETTIELNAVIDEKAKDKVAIENAFKKLEGEELEDKVTNIFSDNDKPE